MCRVAGEWLFRRRRPDRRRDVAFGLFIFLPVVDRHDLALRTNHGAGVADVFIAAASAQDEFSAPGRALVLADSGSDRGEAIFGSFIVLTRFPLPPL